MPTASKSKLAELQSTMSKMTLEVCCVAVLPELGLRWPDVSRAIRGSRLPMTSASAARVLCRHIARSLPAEEYDDLLSRLRLKLVATQQRVWHLVSLEEPRAPAEEPLATRVRRALRSAKKPKDMTAVVESVKMGDLVYLSVQLVSASRQGAVLFCATPPGQPVALFSSLGARGVVRAVVEGTNVRVVSVNMGLGYSGYSDESLRGRDVPSLLALHARRDSAPAPAPEYRPAPVLTDNGVDFTNKDYNEEYMDLLLGPNPPLLTDLKIQTSKPFFQPRLKKDINLTIELKSSDVAATLRAWVRRGALAPSSPLVQIFREMQSNSIRYQPDD